MSELDKSLVGTEEYIARVLEKWRAAGVAVAVVHGTEVIYAQGFGVRETGKPAPIDANTLFQVGSTTKAFTTAALGLLVDEGKLRWDDPVTEYLPWFKVQDPWLTQQLTIRDTVTHRSGINGHWYFVLGIMDSLQAVHGLRDARPDGAFRDSYLYSNLMYAVAGHVIEAACGITWGEFVKQRLLRPLGMSRSGTSPYEFWDARYVATAFFGSAPAGGYGIEQGRDPNTCMPHGWDKDGKVVVLPWQSYDSAAAAGSVVSTAGEMANWLVMHLNEGSFAGRQIVMPETVRELHSLQSARVAQQPPFDSNHYPETVSVCRYAMGWFRGRYRGLLHLSHGGGMLGFPAYVAFMPEREIGIVVLANGPQAVRDELALNRAIAFWVLDRLLGEPRRDWGEEFLAAMHRVTEVARREEAELQQVRIPDSPPSLPLGGYAGIYEDHAGHSGPVRVAAESGRLLLSFPGVGAFSGRLEPWHGDLFRLHANAEVDTVLDWGGLQTRFVAFTLDGWGRVSSMSAFGALFERSLKACT